jgi:DNA-binding MarR family transcriptional regulator
MLTLVDAEMVSRLSRVVGRLARRLNAEATDAGLTPSQASVLALIARHGPLSIAELTQLEGLNPTMLSRVIGKLDDGGLIVRTPDPDDARSAWVECTPEGRRIHQLIRESRAATVSACVARLPQDQADALAGALPALEALASELRAQARSI